MAYGDRTKPSKVEAWLEERLPGYQFGWVLLLLVLTFIVMASGPPDAWVRILTVLLQGLTLLAALLASRVSRRLFRIASIVALVALVAAIGSVVLSSSKDPTSVFFVLNILLVATTPVVIARALWRRQIVDVRTVLGAVCIYVLLGMMFAFVYGAINGIDDTPFFVQTTDATTPDFLYFSFITQTTVGYGDFTAAGDLGRAARGGRGARRAALPRDGHRGAREPVEQAPAWEPIPPRSRRPRARSPPRPESFVGLGDGLEQVALIEVVEQPERRQDDDRGDDEHDHHRPQCRIGCRGGRELRARRQDVRLLRDAPADDDRRHRTHGEHACAGMVLAQQEHERPDPADRGEDHQRQARAT